VSAYPIAASQYFLLFNWQINTSGKVSISAPSNPQITHALRMSENRGPRRIFGPKREEVAGGWRRLHNEELHILYASPNFIMTNKSRRM
jgi:hypothetical protein